MSYISDPLSLLYKMRRLPWHPGWNMSSREVQTLVNEANKIAVMPTRVYFGRTLQKVHHISLWYWQNRNKISCPRYKRKQQQNRNRQQHKTRTSPWNSSDYLKYVWQEHHHEISSDNLNYVWGQLTGTCII